MRSFLSLRRVALAAGVSFAVLSGMGSSFASAGVKDSKPKPKPAPIVAPPVCKAVPLPSALPAGLALFGVVGVIAFRERQKAVTGR